MEIIAIESIVAAAIRLLLCREFFKNLHKNIKKVHIVVITPYTSLFIHFYFFDLFN